MEKVSAHLIQKSIQSNDTNAFALYEKSRFGEKAREKIIYSLSEALYLVERSKLELVEKSKILSKEEIIKKFSKIEKKFLTKYIVFKDLRDKGYIVKTALKFGAEFRVYDRGKKPGEEHARWIIFTDSETGKLTWHEFAAKNRVAHSTKKKMLLAIVDQEEDVNYYEVGWIKI